MFDERVVVHAAIGGIEVYVRRHLGAAAKSELAAVAGEVESLASDALPVWRAVAVCLRLRVSPLPFGSRVLGAVSLAQRGILRPQPAEAQSFIDLREAGQ